MLGFVGLLVIEITVLVVISYCISAVPFRILFSNIFLFAPGYEHCGIKWIVPYNIIVKDIRDLNSTVYLISWSNKVLRFFVSTFFFVEYIFFLK